MQVDRETVFVAVILLGSLGLLTGIIKGIDSIPLSG